MERIWNEECFADALRCWDSGQGVDDTIRRARERLAVRYFWKALGMEEHHRGDSGKFNAAKDPKC